MLLSTNAYGCNQSFNIWEEADETLDQLRQEKKQLKKGLTFAKTACLRWLTLHYLLRMGKAQLLSQPAATLQATRICLAQGRIRHFSYTAAKIKARLERIRYWQTLLKEKYVHAKLKKIQEKWQPKIQLP